MLQLLFNVVPSTVKRRFSRISIPEQSYNDYNKMEIKGLFTRRKGYPSKRVNPGWRAKDSPGLQAKFHRKGNPTTWDNLMRGYTLEKNRTFTRVGGLTLPGVFAREKVNPPARITLTSK